MEIIIQNISRSHHFCYKICYHKKDHWAVISKNTERTGYAGFVLILTAMRKKTRIFMSYTVHVLYESAEILNRYADRFPIAKGMEQAKANYTAAMSLKEDSVDEEFKEIMESILGMI